MADANSDEQATRGSRGSIRTLVSNDRTRISLRGDVDAALNAELTEAVAAAEAAGLPTSVDTREVTFIDSSGMALLARLAGRTPERLQLIDPPGVLTFLLEVTRIGDVVDVVRTDRGGPPDDEPPDVVA